MLHQLFWYVLLNGNFHCFHNLDHRHHEDVSIKKQFVSFKILKDFFSHTFALEFSSAVITVRTGIFLSLSDRQRGKGFSRRCRFRLEMIGSFSLLSSFGVTVERVLSNNLIN